MFKNHKSNSQLKVDDKMNEQDAGQVGKMQALALIILVVGVSVLMVCLGVSLLVF